jgi:hypothetical protein
MKKVTVFLVILVALALIFGDCGRSPQETPSVEPPLAPTETPTPTPEPASLSTIPIIKVEWERVEQLPPLGTNRFPITEEWSDWQEVFELQVSPRLVIDPEFLPPTIKEEGGRLPNELILFYNIIIDGEVVFVEAIDENLVGPALLYPGTTYLAITRHTLRFLYSLDYGKSWTELSPPTDWFTAPSNVHVSTMRTGLRIMRSESQVTFYVVLDGRFYVPPIKGGVVWKTTIQKTSPS